MRTEIHRLDTADCRTHRLCVCGETAYNMTRFHLQLVVRPVVQQIALCVGRLTVFQISNFV
jgi:hypothetical protein